MRFEGHNRKIVLFKKRVQRQNFSSRSKSLTPKMKNSNFMMDQKKCAQELLGAPYGSFRPVFALRRENAPLKHTKCFFCCKRTMTYKFQKYDKFRNMFCPVVLYFYFCLSSKEEVPVANKFETSPHVQSCIGKFRFVCFSPAYQEQILHACSKKAPSCSTRRLPDERLVAPNDSDAPHHGGTKGG